MKKQGRKGLFSSPKGMHDILPQDGELWEKLRKEIRGIAESYNYRRIDTTMLKQPLFLNGLWAPRAMWWKTNVFF